MITISYNLAYALCIPSLLIHKEGIIKVDCLCEPPFFCLKQQDSIFCIWLLPMPSPQFPYTSAGVPPAHPSLNGMQTMMRVTLLSEADCSVMTPPRLHILSVPLFTFFVVEAPKDEAPKLCLSMSSLEGEGICETFPGNDLQSEVFSKTSGPKSGP